jgi:hypothetical protein
MPINKWQKPVLWDQFNPSEYLDFCPSFACHRYENIVAFRRNKVPPEWGRGQIWLVVVDDELLPKANPYLLVESGEDPRLIVLNDRLFLFYVCVEFDDSDKVSGSHINVSELKFTDKYYIDHLVVLPKNPIGLDWKPANSLSNYEKNWVPFLIDKANTIGIIYSHKPWVVLELSLPNDQASWKFIKFHSDAGIDWCYGEIRGGCVPVSYSADKLITIFHSSCITGSKKIYYSGACVFSKIEPFAPCLITKDPLIISPYKSGSDRFGWQSGQPIIFPLGLKVNLDLKSFEVLCSVDDAFIAKYVISIQNLCESLSEILNTNHAELIQFRHFDSSQPDLLVLLDQSEKICFFRSVRFYYDLKISGSRYIDIGSDLGSSLVVFRQLFTECISISSTEEVGKFRERNFLINGIDLPKKIKFDEHGLKDFLDQQLDGESLVRVDLIFANEICIQLVNILISKNIRFIIKYKNNLSEEYLKHLAGLNGFKIVKVIDDDPGIDFYIPSRYAIQYEWYI